MNMENSQTVSGKVNTVISSMMIVETYGGLDEIARRLRTSLKVSWSQTGGGDGMVNPQLRR